MKSPISARVSTLDGASGGLQQQGQQQLDATAARAGRLFVGQAGRHTKCSRPCTPPHPLLYASTMAPYTKPETSLKVRVR